MPAPSWTAIGIYYVALIVVLSGQLGTTRRKIFALAALILIVLLGLWRWESSRNETELTVLPLNGGHAVWIKAAGRNNDWLVDCGDEKGVEYVLKPYLQAQGVNRIPRLLLTDGELRNCGGALSLDELFGIGELDTGPVHFRSSAYQKIVAEFEKPPGRHKTLKLGNVTGNWTVLYPDATNNFTRADDNALVLLGNFSGTKILLLSDLSLAGQTALLESSNDLRADIVIAGLPEDSEPLCGALLGAIQPKAIVIADSEYPATRRASRELKERLAGQSAPVIYTRTSSAVTISMDKNGWVLETMDGQTIEFPK